MYTIDFLQNQGLPRKSRVFEVGLFTGVAAFSVVGLCLLGIQYFHNSTVLKSCERELCRCESKVEGVCGELSAESSLEKRLVVYEQCRFEIAREIGRYVQWTPLLREFVSSLPESMMLNTLDVVRGVKMVKSASVIDPTKKVDVEIIHRSLISEVYDFTAGAASSAVESYRDSLRNSQQLKGVLDKAYISKSGYAEYEDADGKKRMVKNYVINCRLKSQEIADRQ